MHTLISNQTNDEATYWVGADVALVRPGQHYPATPLRAVPVATFARNAEGVGQFLAWLADQLQDVAAPVSVRKVMEATGQCSVELAGWFNEQCPALAPAIANPRQTKAHLASMELRNKTDRVEARAGDLRARTPPGPI